jgi:hypothetical protein
MEAHKFDPNTGEDEMAFAKRLAGAETAAADAIRKTPQAGARSAATRIVPAAAARSTSTATASTGDFSGDGALTPSRAAVIIRESG